MKVGTSVQESSIVTCIRKRVTAMEVRITRRFPVNANGKQDCGARVEAHSAGLTRMSMTWRRANVCTFLSFASATVRSTEEQASPISITRRPSICHAIPDGTLPRSFPPPSKLRVNIHEDLDASRDSTILIFRVNFSEFFYSRRRVIFKVYSRLFSVG